MDPRGTHVKDLDIGAAIDGPADVDTLFLTTRQGDTAFTDLGEVTVREELQVGVQARVGDGLPIPIGIEIPAEANVLTDSGVLQPV